MNWLPSKLHIGNSISGVDTFGSMPSLGKVDYIVPTWNSADTLEKCLISIEGQGRPNRIIIVDNHSTDGTQRIARDHFVDGLSQRKIAIKRRVSIHHVRMGLKRIHKIVAATGKKSGRNNAKV